MNPAIRTKLSVMMFLEYVIYGAWLPLLNLYLDKYLHFNGDEKAWINNAFASRRSPPGFSAGSSRIATSKKSKFLAVSHLIGGLAMLALIYCKTFWPMFFFMLLHCFFYVPTMSVTNAIAFANIKDAQKDFGLIRVWGTIGWIAASWPFIFIPIDWARVPSMQAAGGFVSWLGTALGTPKTGAGDGSRA